MMRNATSKGAPTKAANRFHALHFRHAGPILGS
jgi:hypothetical protein